MKTIVQLFILCASMVLVACNNIVKPAGDNLKSEVLTAANQVFTQCIRKYADMIQNEK